MDASPDQMNANACTHFLSFALILEMDASRKKWMQTEKGIVHFVYIHLHLLSILYNPFLVVWGHIAHPQTPPQGASPTTPKEADTGTQGAPVTECPPDHENRHRNGRKPTKPNNRPPKARSREKGLFRCNRGKG